MRIVSLIPSATEILFAVGAGDDVVGVTFECDHPAQARERRVVSSTTLPEGLSPREIDDAVARRGGRRAGPLPPRRRTPWPTSTPTSSSPRTSARSAPSTSPLVDDALAHLGCTADVLTVDPHTLDDVLDSVVAIGRATGHEGDALTLVASLRERLDAVRSRVAGRERPRVVVLEWTDPPYAPGHWIPEMVTAAGGEPVLGAAGAKSVRVTWDAVHAARPDVVVVAPCGFDRAAAQRAGRRPRGGRAAPGRCRACTRSTPTGSWARPGPRLVDGVEELAALLHP